MPGRYGNGQDAVQEVGELDELLRARLGVAVRRQVHVDDVGGEVRVLLGTGRVVRRMPAVLHSDGAHAPSEEGVAGGVLGGLLGVEVVREVHVTHVRAEEEVVERRLGVRPGVFLVPRRPVQPLPSVLPAEVHADDAPVEVGLPPRPLRARVGGGRRQALPPGRHVSDGTPEAAALV